VGFFYFWRILFLILRLAVSTYTVNKLFEFCCRWSVSARRAGRVSCASYSSRSRSAPSTCPGCRRRACSPTRVVPSPPPRRGSSSSTERVPSASPTELPRGTFNYIYRKPQRVHIFTRDETGLMYLSTQLERTLQLYW
jgi:hypothetical protein